MRRVGTNAKMSEAAAAIGLANLDQLPQLLDLHARNHECYEAVLAEIPGMHLWHAGQREGRNCQYVVVEIDADTYGLSCDQLQPILQAEGLLVKRYFHPTCHRMAPYASTASACPIADRLAARLLCFPSGQGMTVEDIQRLQQLLGFLYQHSHTHRRVTTGHAGNRRLTMTELWRLFVENIDDAAQADQEVYCRLKKCLPAPYTITAEPQSTYFSEWQFDYRVAKGDAEVARWSGDYRQLPPGMLVAQCEQWLVQEGLVTPW